MHIHNKADIQVIDAFIQKFAERYLAQRSHTLFDYSTLNQDSLFGNIDFDTNLLQKIITSNAAPIDLNREQGNQPHVLNDIYRSDLGELLMTYYFEEKLPDGEKFIIPLKNISFRERADMPGRGLDAIGYKISDNSINILLGEAKVSEAMQSPPSVVDSNSDSIYHTQKKYRDNKSIVIQRLTDYARRLNGKDAQMIGFAIITIQKNLVDLYDITYGCTLIRDYNCINEVSDFGKMKTHTTDFDPEKVHFSILSFSDKTIREVVQLFYEKVQILISQ